MSDTKPARPTQADVKEELVTIEEAWKLLEPLDVHARVRVLSWLTDWTSAASPEPF